MRNSSCSSAMPQKPDSEISRSDEDDTELYDVDDTDSPKPDFLFKFEYQTREILKALEKLNGIDDYVAFQPQKNRSCFMEEAKEASGSAGKSNCDSIVTKEEGLNKLVHEEIPQDFRDGVVEAEKKLDVDEANCGPKEGFEQLVREIDVHEEKIYQDFCSIASEESDVKHVVTEADVHEEMSHSDKEESETGDERVATSHEDELLSEEDIVSSESVSSEEDIVSLEDIGLGKPRGFDEEDKDIMEQLKELEELCRTDDRSTTTNGCGITLSWTWTFGVLILDDHKLAVMNAILFLGKDDDDR